MKITIKTAGLLGKYLPPGSAGNDAELEVAEGATPRDVIAQLGMPLDASYLVTLNGESVPTAERRVRTLADNDRLAIMPPLKGG
ncbi:MAG: MoaD/ThiS family protein [Proteobacteria bacterium]|nr:MoaD/ThiS family protein [Pseudomonadota bacterium]